MMGQKNQFVDLRVLLVSPDQARYDLLQMAMDGFRFDRLERANDTQSAMDQLFFNSFDLVVLSGSLSADTIHSLVDSLLDGDMAVSCNPVIYGLCEPQIVSKPAQTNKNTRFCTQKDNTGAIRIDLLAVFEQAQHKKQEFRINKSRAQHSLEAQAAR